jgi:putative ABC transport system permease protein
MKKLLGLLATVWVGLSTHKLRSSLTILGVVIGVASVITLMSIGKGSTAEILSRIQSMGANMITISPGASTFGGVRGAVGGVRTLTVEDAEAIAQDVPYISAVAPSYNSNLQLVVGSKNTNSQVIGTTTDYMLVNNLEIASGAFFSGQDYQSGAKVAVLGSNVAQTLFDSGVDPIGQQMRMGSIIVRVTGVLASKGAGFGSTDDAIIIPLTTMQQTVAQPRTAQGDRIVSSITLTMTDEKQSTLVTDEITSLLRSRHKLAASAADDFRIQSVEELASALTETTNTMTLLLGAIAAISLLVGGIGVMNIMLVSVLERTREIGIRKALGAREQDIWIQFLVEAIFLTLVGGIIGVTVGWGAAYLVPILAPTMGMGQMPTLVTADIVILAVSVSVGIGLFFGFYPAWNASRLNPIEALRSE